MNGWLQYYSCLPLAHECAIVVRAKFVRRREKGINECDFTRFDLSDGVSNYVFFLSFFAFFFCFLCGKHENSPRLGFSMSMRMRNAWHSFCVHEKVKYELKSFFFHLRFERDITSNGVCVCICVNCQASVQMFDFCSNINFTFCHLRAPMLLIVACNSFKRVNQKKRKSERLRTQ